jgi:hypothetical protein
MKLVLHGGDVQDKGNYVFARGPDWHAQISCQLRDFGVPEVHAFRWRERDNLKYLTVGPACRSLFSSAVAVSIGYLGMLTRKKRKDERCEVVLILYGPYGDQKRWNLLG